MEKLKAWKCFGGVQEVWAHHSAATGTRMELSVFLPPGAGERPLPALYWLSGLTCTWENFTAKAGAQRWAAAQGLVLVAPDTSPRGAEVADEPGWDIGQGAGFYVDATEAPWSRHYRMASYVNEELPTLVEATFPVLPGVRGISGHSMGGHGALTSALRSPERWRSVSALAPIVAPSQVPWGEKAFSRYLGEDRSRWLEHDACALVKARGWAGDILVDQGGVDEFLEVQLQPQRFEEACKQAGVPLISRVHPGYDHSYYFVASFIGDHVAWHADRLGRE